MTAVTWNPLDKDAGVALSGSNLIASGTNASSTYKAVRATLGRSTGQWYFEGKVGATSSGGFGLMTSSGSLGLKIGGDVNGWAILDGTFSGFYGVHNNSLAQKSDVVLAVGGIFMVAVDLDAGKLWLGYNGHWFGSAFLSTGDPATATNPTYTGLTGTFFPAWACSPFYATSSIEGHFDELSIQYPIPAGFSPWDATATGHVGTNKLAALDWSSASQLAVSGGVVTGNSPTIKLSGASLVVSRGILTAVTGVVVPLTGQAATAQQGALGKTLGVTLLGQAVTAQQGVVSTNIGGNISVPLVGQELSTQQGTIIFNVVVGATTTYPITPAAVQDNFSTVGADNFPISDGWAIQNNFLPFNGKLQGIGEDGYLHVSGNLSAGRQFGYEFNQTTRGKVWDTASWAGGFWNTPGDFQNFDPFFGGAGDHFVGSSPIAWDYLGGASAPGGQFSLDLDGNMHFMHTRGHGLFAGVSGTTPDIVFYYQVSNLGGIVFSRPAFAIDGQHELAMGVYGHTSDNGYIFYPAQNGSDWVPAYRRWNGTSLGAEVKLTSFTGASACNAQMKHFCAVRSGYGDTIYICYKSGSTYIGVVVMDAVTEVVASHVLTAVTTNTTTFIGVGNQGLAAGVPTRSLAEVVQLSSGTSVTQFLLGGSPGADSPQFVHLSWDSSTPTAPTLTLKVGPSAFGLLGGWESLEVKGDQVFHVLYKRTIVSSAFVTGRFEYVQDFDMYSNDATTSGATWAATASPVWRWTERFDTNQVGNVWSNPFSGYGGGGQTVVYSVPTLFVGRAYSERQAHLAWIDYWAGQPAYMSVSARGRVGKVTISITNETSVALVGQSMTAQRGALGTTISIPLVGQAVTVQASVFGVSLYDVPLTGQQATVQAGLMIPTPGATPAGQQASMQGGFVFPVIRITLDSRVLTVSGGSVRPAMAYSLTGLQIAAERGVLGVTNSPNLTGQSLLAFSGVLTPTVSYRLTGAELQVQRGVVGVLNAPRLVGAQLGVSAGILGVVNTVALVGQQATVMPGALAFHYDCNVYPLGVEAIGFVGTYPIRTNVPPIKPEYHLWVVQEEEPLAADEEPKDLHV